MLMKVGPISLPDPQTLVGLPEILARVARGLDDLTEVLRDDVDAAGGRGDEIRELRSVAETLHRDLQEVRGELGWLRANLESIQDKVPGLSPPGR